MPKPNQYTEWEREYKNPAFLTKNSKPQKETLRFLKYLKKQGTNITESNVLDLGCGTGRNTNYIASLGAKATGIELSTTALHIARSRAQHMNMNVEYIEGDMGQPLPFSDNQFDCAIDVMSSNSLTEMGRSMYMSEVHRVLKTGGYLYLKALCKEGDKNAKELLKKSPGIEPDTYIMPVTGITERVFDESSLRSLYGVYFDIVFLNKTSHYVKIDNRLFKRNYWVCYMQKK